MSAHPDAYSLLIIAQSLENGNPTIAVHAADWSVSLCAYSSTATACSCVTSGKQSRYSSRLRPLSRLVNKLSTGTRVPLNKARHSTDQDQPRSALPADSSMAILVSSW